MSTIGRTIGYILWIGSGGLMFIFWLTAMNNWLGLFGSILAFILAPGLVVFPIIYWLVEKVFPAFYFLVWFIGIVGCIILAVFSKDD